MTDIHIPPEALTQGRLKEVLDYDPETGQFRWRVQKASTAKKGTVAGSLNSHGYIYIRIDGIRYSAHRLAWLWVTGQFPPEYIDHINHNRADNRISNLRAVTDNQNQYNYPIPKHNKSGVVGVHWYNRANKWRARIMVNRKHIELGTFDTIEAACAARSAAKLRYHSLPLTEKPDGA